MAKSTFAEMYTSGEYLEKWPNWHVETSPWAAKQIFRMIRLNSITPTTICEIGCGAGEILRQLQMRMENTCEFWGYEISPQALELAKSRENERLRFKLADIRQETTTSFDLILMIDVIEHVENFFDLLRNVKAKSAYKIFHIPLDLTVRAILRGTLLEMLEEHGHIHYFTRELALQMLKDVGYEVLDYFYTSPTIDLPTNGFVNETRRRLMILPRKLLFAFHQDLAARVIGGWSLMVLAK